MTNEQIIFSARLELMEKGIIGTTGRTLEMVNEKGEKSVIAEPEPIHTFNGWKSRGYQVKKGEKSNIKFTIWKYTSRKVEKDGKEEDKESMFMKNAAFFTFAQVEPIKEKKAK